MNREEKIDFLKRLEAGETDLSEVGELKPFGFIYYEEGKYRLEDGRLLNEEEYKEFIEPYDNCKKRINGQPIIYGVLIK